MTTQSHFWGEPLWVSPDIIRQEFNQRQIFEKLQRGELRQRIFRPDDHLKARQRRKLGEPRCTRSQIALYSEPDGTPIALVHQYRRRDGTLGGGGKPDPKRLFVSGRVIAVQQSP